MINEYIENEIPPTPLRPWVVYTCQTTVDGYTYKSSSIDKRKAKTDVIDLINKNKKEGITSGKH